MWVVYRNDQVLYKPGLREWPLWDCTLETRLSKSGELKFTVYADNPQFYEILQAGTINEDVYRVDYDGEPIWYGRPYQVTEDVIGGYAEVSVEGELGYLNDSVVPVYHYSGRPPDGWVAYLLTQHNNQCPEHPFLLGNVTIKAPEENGNITRWAESPKKVWDELYEKTVNSSTGGYLMLRHEGGNRYVDWVAEPSVPGAQPVVLGSNLLKLVGENDGSKIVTALYPFGEVKTDPETEETTYTTIDGYDIDRVWGGDVRKQGPYVVNIELERRHGWVCDVFNDSSVSQPGTLLNNAILKCRSLADNVNYEASAVDLRNAGYDYEMFRIGQRVPLKAGDIDRTMLITGVTYDLTDASQGKVVFGPITMSSSAFGTSHVRTIDEVNDQVKAALKLADTSVKHVRTQYAVSTSGSSFIPAGEEPVWTYERPETSEGEWVWERDEVTYGEGSSFYTGEEQPSPLDAAEAAIEAQEGVDRIENHFWADAQGVHVSRTEGDAEGDRNILMDSESMLIRKRADNLVSITEDAMSFWDGTGNDPENVLATFGRDGARVGRGNEVHSTVAKNGFSIESGGKELFSVTYDSRYDDEPWLYRRVYKVYYAGYMAPTDQELENAVDEYAHFSAAIDDPSAQLYFGDTWESDGYISGATGMLMSVQDYIDNSDNYSAYGDISEYMSTRYDAASAYSTDQREYRVKYRNSEYIPFTCGFSPEVLAQIPTEVWSDAAVEAGAPNWFFGSVSLAPDAKLMLNGAELSTDTTAYNVRMNQVRGVMSNDLHGHLIVFTAQDGSLLAANEADNDSKTSKALTTEPFDPYAPIYYYSATEAVAAGSAPDAVCMYTQYGGGLDLRTAFNAGSTLVANKAAYVRCVPQAGGMVRLDGDQCVTQDLPESEDGRVYLRLGTAYSATSVTLDIDHPLYEYRNGSIRKWDNAPYTEHLSNIEIDEICV